MLRGRGRGSKAAAAAGSKPMISVAEDNDVAAADDDIGTATTATEATDVDSSSGGFLSDVGSGLGGFRDSTASSNYGGFRDSTASSNYGGFRDSTVSSAYGGFRDSTASSASARSSSSSSVVSTSSSMRSSSNFSTSSDRIRLSYAESVKNINVENLTVNKLRLSSLGLHGRKAETKKLKGCFQNFVHKLVETDKNPACDGKGEAVGLNDFSEISTEVVFISGESGTGKTALAESIKKVVRRRGGIYITGKFDLQNRREPFFGIISLFRELCGEILQLRLKSNSKYGALCDAVLSEVGDQVVLLSKVVPALKEVIDIPENISAVPDQGSKEAKERLKYGFLQFFRVISRYFDHLVMVLDDLQWTDALSIELLDGIIGDKDIRIMFIGIYRSNEVDEAHYLSKTIRDMHAAKGKGGFDVTEISVGNLDASVCEDILAHLLSVDPSAATSRLAEICHKRTGGNAFHLLSYLAMLQEENLLEFNLGMFKWTWDCDKIEEETAASSNVVELILTKIAKQPQEMKYLLQLVSCLGTSFERDVVVCAFLQMCDGVAFGDSELENEVDELISLAIVESFLEPQGDSRYCWVHDSIQEAASKQLCEKEMRSFKYKLGKALFHSLSKEDVENNLFDIVSLLSSAEECPEEDRVALLSLCLRAAKKSKELTGFESCISYAERGISLLPVDKWTQEREVSLELYSLIVEAHFIVVDIEKMNVFRDEVLRQPTLSELEKVPVHICNISLYAGVMNKAQDALDMSITVLRKLGCKFPRNKLLQARLALSSISTTKLPTEEDIADLPPMKDETRKACMEIMINAATYSHHCNNVFAFIMITARMVRWTMQYGVDVNSAPAFTAFGMVKSVSSYKKGALFADRGFQLLDMCEVGKRAESRVTYLSWGMVYPFSKPVHSTLSHLLRGYKAGMEMGDVESAMWNVSMYIGGSFNAGKALKPLAVDCITYMEQMKMLKQDFIYHMSLPYAQGVLTMLGDAENLLKLSGSVMVEENFLAMIETSQGGEMSRLTFLIVKNMICNFFGDFEQGAKLALERGDEYEKKNGSPLAMIDTVHQGISLYAMARKTKEKKYIKAAKKSKKKVAAWAKKGSVNTAHYVTFLEAEDAALEGRSDDTTKLYSRAMTSAARSGFQHDAALVSERYAEYLLHDLKDFDKAGLYFKDSIKYYEGWGSDCKVDMLRKKYSYLWVDEVPIDINVNV